MLCQWCYLVSHTSKCWPRGTWGSLEHRTSWSDALNCAPQRLFSSCSLNPLQKFPWNSPSQGKVALRAPRMQFSNCSFPGYWAKLLKGISLLPFASLLLLRWPSFQLKKGCMRPPKPVGATPEYSGDVGVAEQHEAHGCACLCITANKKQRTEPKSWILIPAW